MCRFVSVTEEDGGTITFMAKWKLSEDAKPDNVIVDVTPREIVFKDPRNDFRVVEKYNYFQIKRWAIGALLLPFVVCVCVWR